MEARFAPGMSLTNQAWANLFNEAAGLVKIDDFLGSYSERSQAILDQIDAPDAWAEDDNPRSLQRVSMGAAHAYLTELLLQPFLAWQAGAVLGIGEADCHLLADVAKFLVEGDRLGPFPIPDLRPGVRPGAARVSGKIPNFAFERLADVEVWRADPSVQAYAHRLQSIVTAPRGIDARTHLEAALMADRPPGLYQEATDSDIAVALKYAEILGNVDLRIKPTSKAFADYAQRQFASHGLRIIVLIEDP